MKAPLVRPMDQVALMREVPESSLGYGESGVVIQVSREKTCDIEFVNSRGKSVIVKGFPMEDLVLVRKARG